VTDEQIEDLAESWISSEGSGPAFEQLYDLILDDPENGWLVIQEIATRKLPEEVMAVFAAGPVEGLLAHHGQKLIDRVEEKARLNERFNCILGGVWQNMMSDDIWERVKKVRREVW
jgi:hypothetical protein